MSTVLRHSLQAIAVVFLLSVSACQTGGLHSNGAESDEAATGVNAQALSSEHAWVLQSFTNSSHTHTAAEVAATLLETHLFSRGVSAGRQAVLKHRYEITGEVIEWHYSGGVSPKPVVKLQLAVRDLQSGKLAWTDAISGEGSRRESLSAFADSLMGSLVNRLPITKSVLNKDGEPAGTVLPAKPVIPVDSNALIASGSLVGAGVLQRNASHIPAVSGALAIKSTASAFIDAQLPDNSEPLSGRSVAFFYAANPPVDVLSQFDRIVLEPDNIKGAELQQLTVSGAATFAYLSVGEVGPHRDYASSLQPEWILGKNPSWNSDVLDLSNPDMRNFLLGRVVRLQKAGYDGVFLDTMDSYNLIAKTSEEKEQQREGLIQLVKDIGSLPKAPRVITNRGFEVLDDIAQHIEAVAAESLYASWNNEIQRYKPVSEDSRAWLLGKLEHAKDTLSLDVIAIDYLPPEQRAQARDIASRIVEHGFIPWVANPSLDYIGVGALEVIPRKVLMVYDSKIDGPIDRSPVHKFIAMPVEYLGYVPEYLDIASQSWPAGELKGRYAGVVTWAGREFKKAGSAEWVQKQLDDTVPMVFIGRPPVAVDDRMAQSLGISVSGKLDFDSAKPVYTDALINPEKSLSPRIDGVGLIARSIASGNTVHMSYADKDDLSTDVVVTGSFGGFAWQPAVVEHGLDNEVYWVVDPFEFLRKSLQLPDAPMPDVSSENGKRLWLAHIDGDALPSWSEMPGQRLGAEIIYENILKKYPLPHTVSVVEGEMTAFPAYADRRQRMFDIVRNTFELDHVELASHTYSHPFKWAKLIKHRFSGKYNLDIPGYVYTPERDIIGSLAFVDRELAPADKKTAVMLWSGDALPGEKELAVLASLGLPNMNGGITSITNARNTMTLVSPMARPIGDYLQVYAPIINENMYTNDWLGPFDGFKRVIETFKLTEYPRRLKPLNVYYHFYSGTKVSSMKALESVYKWSMEQDIFPVYTSDYAHKVPDYRNAGVARYLTGQWKVSGLGTVRSLRILGQKTWPDLSDSQGLVGARKLHDGVYLHTNGADQIQFKTVTKKPARIHLVSSNGKVLRWDDNAGRLVFRIAGEVPVSVELSGASARGCTLRANGKTVTGRRSGDSSILFSFTTRDTGDATLNCPA